MTTNTRFKNILILALAAVVIFLLFFRDCGRKKEDKSDTIKTPEITNILPTIIEPEPISPPEPIYIVKWRTKVDTIEIENENPINLEFWHRYTQAKNDSVERARQFADAISFRDYVEVSEDSFVKITNRIKVQGFLKEITPEYTIKPQSLKVPQTVFRIYGGGELGNTKEFDNFTAKGNILIQNRKGNILSISADTEERFWLGYNFSIWNYKK